MDHVALGLLHFLFGLEQDVVDGHGGRMIRWGGNVEQ
jgi:hypothetical protein